ncbi:MAG TPA: L-rhamnose/proton symporter RhaT [Phycisphaerae bacterium]|nr:L-rhamnose/proton symporter RhaT [Phycisphaerae bacterium]
MVLGFLFVLVGAICGGSFGLPSKFAKKDTPWENLWGPFFFFATILIPVTLGPFAADGLFSTCSAAGWQVLLPVLVFGFLWGLGSMTLGMSFAFIGLSLAYAINYGAQIATGSMVPMLLHHADQIPTARGYVVLAGVAVCLVGVVVAGRAGILKDRSLKADGPAMPEPEAGGAKKPKMGIGLIIAFISGILCACYAVAFSYGDDVMTVSQKQFGNPVWRSTFVVTALVLWGGAVSSCVYCVVQLTRNGTWKRFLDPGVGRILLLAAVMAVLHDGAILFWGLGAARLGDLGVSVGYAAFMSLAIIVGNVHGFRTGEWKGASRRSIGWIVAGILILIIGVCILGKGNAMPKG